MAKDTEDVILSYKRTGVRDGERVCREFEEREEGDGRKMWTMKSY
jgi:hypothetical protein